MKENGFGRLLKFWRGVHGLSQEALALSLESSTRHISCLENGKARPSRSMIDNITRVMSLGERDSCHLLHAGGFLAEGKVVDFYAAEFKWLRKAMLMSLKAMDPFPAVLMDRYGKLLMVNRGWVAFYRKSMSAEQLNGVMNHYDFLFNGPRSMPRSADWGTTLSLILMALKQEALLNDDPLYLSMLETFTSHPDVPVDWMQRAAKMEPMASFRVEVELAGELQSFFSISQMVSAMGATNYVSEPRLIINSLYPEQSDLDLSELMQDNLQHPLLAY